MNETLKESGERVEDFGEDFRDGVRLAALVERLQRRRLRRTHRRPQSQHHEIENITIALDAIKDDGIKLVNIGESTRRGGGGGGDSSDLSRAVLRRVRLFADGANGGGNAHVGLIVVRPPPMLSGVLC